MTDIDTKPCFFEGKIIPLKDANINVRTHAFNYGTGVFGGIRGYWNEEKNNLYVFRLKDHFKRIQNSAKILQMKLDYSIDELIDITIEIIQKGGWKQNIYIRPLLYKSELELSPRLHNVKDSFTEYVIPLNDYMDTQKGLSACISSWVRIHDNQIPTKAKATGGYINSALAKSEALQNGFDEAIFLDIHGNVSEGSAENLFLVKDKTLITPDLNSSVLEGITRKSIIHLAKELGIKVKERKVSRVELYTADELFFVGTGVQVAWISSLDNRKISKGKVGPISNKIQTEFFNIVKGRNSDYKNWLTPVY